LKDGAGPEAMSAGVACGRLLAVTATEKQGTAFVYDITDPTSPTLAFVQHLSPASETKNPSVAYADGTLGDIDPESIIFLSASDSPTGNAGVMFAGAWSGTLSFYEFLCAPSGGHSVSFSTSSAAPASAAPDSMNLVSRVYVPFSGTSTDRAFGMGAAEQHAWDYVNKYAYVVSEQGFVNIVDYGEPSSPVVKSAWALEISGRPLTDIEVCGGKVFVGVRGANKEDNGHVFIYQAVSRPSPRKPMKLAEVEVGPLPDMVLPSPDCTHLAVANEAEGVDGPDGTLVDPEGSVSIIDLSDNSVQTISLNTKADGTALTDTMMVDMDIHMPLTQNAMRYFDRINDDINWTAAISSYTVATQLEPEYLAWSPDGSKIYVNLQHW
jgi:hypothetical protein